MNQGPEKNLMEYLENSRDSEGINEIIALCDETGNDESVKSEEEK